MRIHNLSLKNIALFEDSFLEFIGDKDDCQKPPVIILTGENGTGKTVVIDAIRAVLMGVSGNIERNIARDNNFEIIIDVSDKLYSRGALISNTMNHPNSFKIDPVDFTGKLFDDNFFCFIDYWTSRLSNDSFKIENVSKLQLNSLFLNSLKGNLTNYDIVRTICYFDYLKDSNDNYERQLGKTFFSLVKRIFEIALLDGEFAYVSRLVLDPIVSIKNNHISLDKLSSGSLYLVQRYINLLKQIFKLCTEKNLDIKDIKNVEGLLLIDEAENHLHPKWQKTFLNQILSIFPNTQIILTTHSPFIVSSVSNSRVFVCSSTPTGSTIKEETDYYRNLPIEEILMSPLFETPPFNTEITNKLQQRKTAIQNNEHEKRKLIEKELCELNPDYFNYFKIDSIIEKLQNETPE